MSEKKKKLIIWGLSFLIPIIIMLIAYVVIGVFPFGNKSVLIMDASGQYVDIFAKYRDIIVNFKSVFYSWSKGLGGDVYSMFGYYAMSPLSLTLILVPIKFLTEGILALTLLKIGLCGLTFNYYLNKSFNKHDISTAIFSTIYALVAYNIVYSLSLMWIDGVIILPLLVLGIERFIKENKKMLLILSLAYIIISNYYIGYMLCVFACLYFIYYYFYNNPIKLNRDFFDKFSKFILYIFVGVGLSAIVLVPAYFGLKSGRMDFDKSQFIPHLNINFFPYVFKLLSGGYDTIKQAGMPNIGSTILSLFLVFLTMLRTDLDKKKKWIRFGLISIIFASFLINTINVIWQGFQIPIWFPFRYSFVFSFVLIFIAFDNFSNMKSYNIKEVKYMTIFMITIFLATCLFTDNIRIYSKYIPLAASVIFLILYAFIYAKKGSNKNIVLYIVILELIFNTTFLVKSLNKEFKYDKRSDYVDFVNQYKPVIKYINNNDKSFYRIEKTFNRSRNDSFSLSYNGVSHFTSLYNRDNQDFLGKLGFVNHQFWVVYNNGGTLFSDSLLNVKYILSDKEKMPYYNIYKDLNDTTVYENPYALPLGFMINKDLEDIKTTNPFELQNNILNSMLNTEDIQYFKKKKIEKIKYENISKSKDGYMYSFDKEKPNYISYDLRKNSNPTYVYITSKQYKEVNLYLNDKFIGPAMNKENRQIRNLYTTDRNMNVKVELGNKNKYMYDVYFYELDFTKFKKAINDLKKNDLKINKIKDGYISANINVDDNQMLFTSIPYEKGWTIKVDGKIVEYKKVYDAFIGFNLEKGNHKLEFNYTSYGFKAGVIVSAISLLLTISIYFYDKKSISISKNK